MAEAPGSGGLQNGHPGSIIQSGYTDDTSLTVFDRLSALADATRSRLLLALDRHELSVTELCSVTQLPQSTVSRHLRILNDEGWVSSRAEGTARHYRLATPLDPTARRLWHVVRDQVAAGREAAQDSA
ncbi:MAG: winged helix-turn-helix transcriptional regulator, partial [Gemmatimonadales bacterium]|nr:winged helix-turn-helix transcriptional regulator [Gemmatimonadales bacterium]